METMESVQRKIYELEQKHPGQEWRPWACRDNSDLALEHWGLVQRRIELARETKRWTPERRKAVGDRNRERRRTTNASDLSPVESRVSP